VQEKILILDFGSQYTQLIARRIRELNVYCEIFPYNNFPDPDASVKGVVLSGSPFSVRNDNAPNPDLSGIKGKFPVLGICYGAQLIVHKSGGEVTPSKTREYGRATLECIDTADPLFTDVKQGTQVWMSHGDTIEILPEGFEINGSTTDVKAASYKIRDERTWGIQFHPEVYHTTDGLLIIKNFVYKICGCKGNWTPDSFIEESIKEFRNLIGDDKVILGLSGGVDSSVAALLLSRAVGDNLTSIFVDNGLLRK
jgi:GMP synthase (glutamine-hydrolysing)